MSGAVDPVAIRLAAVRGRIDAAVLASGRRIGDVGLLAVSKNHDASAVRSAWAAGQRDYGENRVQELVAKSTALRDLDGVRWHMIGSLQTNKVRELLAVPGLVMLHSLDRPKLADALQRELVGSDRRLSVLLQIHATGEASKHGCPPELAAGLLAHVRDRCPNLAVRGVMAMGPLAGDPAPVFRRVVALAARLRAESGLPLDVASLGMSADLEAAIACGSTLVRVGTDVFGART